MRIESSAVPSKSTKLQRIGVSARAALHDSVKLKSGIIIHTHN
eukprot:IDg5737t1